MGGIIGGIVNYLFIGSMSVEALSCRDLTDCSFGRASFPQGPVVAWGDAKLTGLQTLRGYHNTLMVVKRDDWLQGLAGSLSYMLWAKMECGLLRQCWRFQSDRHDAFPIYNISVLAAPNYTECGFIYLYL